MTYAMSRMAKSLLSNIEALQKEERPEDYFVWYWSKDSEYGKRLEGAETTDQMLAVVKEAIADFGEHTPPHKMLRELHDACLEAYRSYEATLQKKGVDYAEMHFELRKASQIFDHKYEWLTEDLSPGWGNALRNAERSVKGGQND